MNTVTTTSYSLNANVASFNTTISSPLMQKLHKNKVLSSVLAIETNGGGRTGKTYTAALPMFPRFSIITRDSYAYTSWSVQVNYIPQIMGSSVRGSCYLTWIVYFITMLCVCYYFLVVIMVCIVFLFISMCCYGVWLWNMLFFNRICWPERTYC